MHRYERHFPPEKEMAMVTTYLFFSSYSELEKKRKRSWFSTVAGGSHLLQFIQNRAHPELILTNYSRNAIYNSLSVQNAIEVYLEVSELRHGYRNHILVKSSFNKLRAKKSQVDRDNETFPSTAWPSRCRLHISAKYNIYHSTQCYVQNNPHHPLREP